MLFSAQALGAHGAAESRRVQGAQARAQVAFQLQQLQLQPQPQPQPQPVAVCGARAAQSARRTIWQRPRDWRHQRPQQGGGPVLCLLQARTLPAQLKSRLCAEAARVWKCALLVQRQCAL